MKSEGNHYLYRHVFTDTGLPFYIGIGTKAYNSNTLRQIYSRAYNKNNRSQLWKNKTKGKNYEVEILFEHDDYEFIKKKEIEFIALYGNFLNNGLLLNLTEGGDGVLGLIGKYNTNSKPVFVYDYSGNYICSYESTLLAEKDLDISRVCISNCINNKSGQNLEYIFFKDFKGYKIESQRKLVRNEHSRKEVTVLNIDSSIFKTFESITEAAEYFKTSRDTIADNCSKEIKIVYKRFYLCYSVDLKDLKTRKPGVRVLKRLKQDE